MLVKSEGFFFLLVKQLQMSGFQTTRMWILLRSKPKFCWVRHKILFSPSLSSLNIKCQESSIQSQTSPRYYCHEEPIIWSAENSVNCSATMKAGDYQECKLCPWWKSGSSRPMQPIKLLLMFSHSTWRFTWSNRQCCHTIGESQSSMLLYPGTVVQS